MIKDEEIKMINEKLDYYMLKASDEESDVEDVLKLIKRLDELVNVNQPGIPPLHHLLIRE